MQAKSRTGTTDPEGSPHPPVTKLTRTFSYS